MLLPIFINGIVYPALISGRLRAIPSSPEPMEAIQTTRAASLFLTPYPKVP